MKTISVLGYEVWTTKKITTNFSKKTIINTINPHSYCVAKKDLLFKEALQASDILLPDGIGIVWATKFLNGEKIQKIAGYDVFTYLINRLNEEGGSCFFLGASEETLEKIKVRLKKEFPNIQVGSFSPPYKSEFNQEDSKMMINAVNDFKPQVLFVGMTAPKQEKWVFQHKNEIDAKIICSIGAVFDFYAGTIKRPSKLWINLKLEWLVRFLNEPKRLFRRNFVSTPKFIWYVLREKYISK